MADDANLARFQAALLNLLAQGLPPATIVERLRADPQLAEYTDYVATFEPRMIAVAIELVAKWGRREGGNLASLQRD